MFRRSCCAILLCLSALSTLPLAFGKSSKLVISWKKPGYLPVEKPYRVLTLGLSDKTSVRADFEDALASQLAVTGTECIPGNTILLRPEGTQFDLQYLTTQVPENRITTIVVDPLIRVDSSIIYVPGTPYIAPYPYYNTF